MTNIYTFEDSTIGLQVRGPVNRGSRLTVLTGRLINLENNVIYEDYKEIVIQTELFELLSEVELSYKYV